jgi:hypothetical protein
MANLIPKGNKNGSLIKADKFFAPTLSSKKITSSSTKTVKTDDLKENIILTIEKKVIKIDNLLKNSLILKKKRAEKERLAEEKKSFSKKESELEKKKPKQEKGGIKLPSAPKMGFLDWIKNFVTQTILGFLFIKFYDFLPTLLKIYPVIVSAGEFLINVGGNILNSLVTFVDWGYKAIDGTRGFIKNIGGEGLAQNFDKFAGAIDNLIEVAVIAALVTAGGDSFGGRDRVDPKRGFDTKGGRVGKEAQRRYAQRFGREQFVDRFGKNNLGNLQGGARRGAFQRGARNAFVGLAGKGGAKQVLNFVRPLTKRLPLIGGLLDFGLSVALGEDPGRAAFKSIGATLFGALGAAIGSLAFGAGAIVGGILGGIGGDALGAALYDILFKNKKPTQKQAKTNKLAGGGKPVSTRGGGKTVSSPRRTLKKKKPKRSITFVPIKIKPGRSAGGEEKVQKVFPNPEKPKTGGGFFGWLGGLFGGGNKQPQQTEEQKPKPKKPNQKVANPQEFLIKSNEVLGRSANFGPFFTLALKTVLGDTPVWMDYLNVGKGLSSWLQGALQPGTLGFSGGGEVDARQFFQGEDYTNVIARSVKDSVSKDIDKTVRNLKDELALRPVGKEEMIEETNRRETEESSQEEFEMGDDSGYSTNAGDYKEILDLISKHESAGAGYNAYNEGGSNNGYKVVGYGGDSRKGPLRRALTDMTVEEIMQHQKNKNPPIHAAGRYQIIGETLKGLMRGAYGPTGVRLTDKFDANTQDKLGIALVKARIRTGANPDNFISEWRGLKFADRKKLQDAINKAQKGRIYSTGQVYDNVSSASLGGYKVTRSGTTIKNYSQLPPHHSYQTTSDGRRVQDFTLYKGNKFVNVPVPSPVTGKVTWTGNAGGGGKWVEIQSSSGKVELGHFNQINARVGQSVQAFRSILGLQGYTGNISPSGPDGTHVHIQAPENIIARYVNTLAKGGASKFHGENFGIAPVDGFILKLHKGEMFRVVDKDSVDLFGFDLTKEIIDIENKSQLIAKAPSIIDKLKAISGYTDDDVMTEIVYVEVPVPEVVPVGSSGGNTLVVAGVNSNMTSFDMEQKLSQVG